MKHGDASAAHPGDGLVRAGAAVFAVGLVAVLAAVAAFLSGRHDVPLWLALTAALLPAGFALALLGLLRGLVPARRH